MSNIIPAASAPDGGTLPFTPDKGLTTTPQSATWKADLDSYQELRALVFASDQEIDAAIDLLWTSELRELPHDLAGGNSLIVPAEAVSFFKTAGLKFQEREVLYPGELPADELDALRKEHGPY